VSALRTLDHVVVVVADLERASANYTAVIGRAPGWRGEHPGQGTANALFPLANCYVELLAARGDGPLGDAVRRRIAERGEGLAALAFGTDDAGACAAAWRGGGAEVSGPRDGGGRDADGAERPWRTVGLAPDATRGVTVFAIEHLSAPLPVPSPTPSEVGALDHVVVHSADVDAARGVYGDALGIRLALDREFPQRGLRLLFFRVGGVTVEIAGRIGEAAGDDDRPDELWGLAYRVADVDAARARLASAGIRVSEVRPGQKKGTRVFTVHEGTHGVATLMIMPEAVDA